MQFEQTPEHIFVLYIRVFIFPELLAVTEKPPWVCDQDYFRCMYWVLTTNNCAKDPRL